jgi:hypothetical protein
MSKNIYQDIEDFALYLKMPVLKVAIAKQFKKPI